MEDADRQGDSKAVYDGVKALAGKTHKRFTKQPTRKKKRKAVTETKSDTGKGDNAEAGETKVEWESIDSPDELGAI